MHRWRILQLQKVSLLVASGSQDDDAWEEHLRTGCDLMNLFFVIDEHTDLSDTKTAREQANIVMNALENPEKLRPAGEWVGGEVTRQ